MVNDIRIGLICRGDHGGLAAQTLDFYRHIRPYRVLLVDYDTYTGYHTDYSLYERADNLMTVDREPSDDVLQRFLDGLDLVFTVETPYNHNLYKFARERGIKTICQYNWEWLEIHQNPDLPRPDLFLAPSKWHFQKELYGVPVKYLHVPVDRVKFPFQQRLQAKKFLHIAGHPTIDDRNGTITVLEALPYIKSDIQIIIRTQANLPRPYTDSRLTIIQEDLKDREDLYNDEDVLILPRRYGGLSLQLNEALSLGMVPIMSDIEPQNKFLVKECLVKANQVGTSLIKTPIQVYDCKPEDLAAKIDHMANQNISYLSQESNAISQLASWDRMKPQYLKVFSECLSQ